MDFSFPLASSPPMQGRTFREKGESSRGAHENLAIMEMLLSMQNKMEKREKEWRLQQEFREEIYEKELKKKEIRSGKKNCRERKKGLNLSCKEGNRNGKQS